MTRTVFVVGDAVLVHPHRMRHASARACIVRHTAGSTTATVEFVSDGSRLDVSTDCLTLDNK